MGWYSGKDALTDHRHSRGGWQEVGWGGTVVRMHSLIIDIAGGRVDGRSGGRGWYNIKVALIDPRHSTWRRGGWWELGVGGWFQHKGFTH